ncbi:MAG: hypothetical protein E4H01_02115, partial [Lysobacterales bacterium]
MKASRPVRRTGGLLCAVAGVLLSGCESLQPDIVKGYTVGEAERAPAKTEAVTPPTTEVSTEREPRPAAFYEPGTGVFVGTP